MVEDEGEVLPAFGEAGDPAFMPGDVVLQPLMNEGDFVVKDAGPEAEAAKQGMAGAKEQERAGILAQPLKRGAEVEGLRMDGDVQYAQEREASQPKEGLQGSGAHVQRDGTMKRESRSKRREARGISQRDGEESG